MTIDPPLQYLLLALALAVMVLTVIGFKRVKPAADVAVETAIEKTAIELLELEQAAIAREQREIDAARARLAERRARFGATQAAVAALTVPTP